MSDSPVWVGWVDESLFDQVETRGEEREGGDYKRERMGKWGVKTYNYARFYRRNSEVKNLFDGKINL